MKLLNGISKTALMLMAAILLAACSGQEAPNAQKSVNAQNPAKAFNPDVFKVADGGVNKVRGQVLYVPIYSNIPDDKKKHFDLSAFIAIHNTDLKNPIKITKVLYFNNDGELVKEFVAAERSLGPLGAANYYIPQADQSGTGANFLVEWIADIPVSEPLIESVMINIEGNRGISFLSTGKVIREIR